MDPFAALSALTQSIIQTTLSTSTIRTTTSLAAATQHSTSQKYHNSIARERQTRQWLLARKREMEGEVARRAQNKANPTTNRTAATTTTTTTTPFTRSASQIRKSIKKLQQQLFSGTVQDQNKLLYMSTLAKTLQRPNPTPSSTLAVRRRLREIRDKKAGRVAKLTRQLDDVRRERAGLRAKLVTKVKERRSMVEEAACTSKSTMVDSIITSEETHDLNDEDDLDYSSPNLNAILRRTLLTLILEAEKDWYTNPTLWHVVAALQSNERIELH